MSFFGFDASLPRDRPHNAQAPGFGAAPDPFAALSQRRDDDDGGVLDFEDTYDGLGDQLEESGDAFNADTFGFSAANTEKPSVGRDFDFSGQTNMMMDTMQDEQALFHARQPPPQQYEHHRQTAQPRRTGYENYREPSYIPNLEANASIWGTTTKTAKTPAPQPQPPVQQQTPQPSTASRKVMSLEEVEAMMRTQPKASATPQPQPAYEHAAPQQPFQQAQSSYQSPAPHQAQPHPQLLQRPQHLPTVSGTSHQPPRVQADELQFGQPQAGQRQSVQQLHHTRNALQQPPSGPAAMSGLPYHGVPPPSGAATMHRRGPSYASQAPINPQQLMDLPEEERATLLAEDAKRAKRNHKIALLSRDNGLMTPQDKNFITRIQLQQLVTATGGLDSQDPDAGMAEDFYYQVHSQIFRGAPRQDPSQPLNTFAQTYLHQTAGRGSRRYPANGQNQMRRMEQQVQRAVEAAKARPKNKQLVVEGSLGKISFSNAKTPKPLLNLRRNDAQDGRPSSAKGRAHESTASKMATLRDIEAVYMTLLNMEEHERRMPPPPREESSGDEIEAHITWTKRLGELNQQLWSELKVLEPIDPSSFTPHPFIAILTHAKGKKLIPRVFRQIDEQQRVTILTMVVVHLDMLDVIRQAIPHAGEKQLPREVRDQIDLFSQAVLPALLNYVADAQLGIVIGLIGLVMDRVNLQNLVMTKIGLSLLTMFISRAELVKQAKQAEQGDLDQWTTYYNQLFDKLEPLLAYVFPDSLASEEDVYVWQFLATMSIGATPDQQQRLVMAVKDRVMDTVSHAKTLPTDLAQPRLNKVNLFLNALGLDVDLLG